MIIERPDKPPGLRADLLNDRFARRCGSRGDVVLPTPSSMLAGTAMRTYWTTCKRAARGEGGEFGGHERLS